MLCLKLLPAESITLNDRDTGAVLAVITLQPRERMEGVYLNFEAPQSTVIVRSNAKDKAQRERVP